MADEFDGWIRIKASIDSSEFDKDIAKLSNKSKILANSISSSSKILSDLKTKYDALIAGTLKTNEEIGLEKSLKRVQAQLDNLQDKYAKTKNKIIREGFGGDEALFSTIQSKGEIPNNILAPLETINSKIKETETTIKALSEKLKEIRMNPETQESVKKLASEIDTLSLKIDKLKIQRIEALDQLKSISLDKLKSSLLETTDKFKEIKQISFDELKNNLLETVDKLKEIRQIRFDELKSNILETADKFKEIKQISFDELKNNLLEIADKFKEIRQIRFDELKSNILETVDKFKEIRQIRFDELKSNILETADKLKEIKQISFDELKSNILETVDKFKEIKQISFDELKNNLLEIADKFKEIKQTNGDNLKNTLSEITDKLKNNLPEIADKAKNAFSGLGKAISAPFSIIGKGISGLLSPIRMVAKGISNLFSRIFRLGTLVLVFNTIRRGFQAFRDYLGKALQTNETFIQSLNQIRSNLLTAFYPIYQAILPVINTLAQALATASAYLAQFVSMLFGQSISSSQAGAKALNDRINATNTSTKATKKHSTALKEDGNEYDKLYKRVKRANGELANFDKLNVLYTNKDKSKKAPDVSAPDVPESPIFTPTVAYDNTYSKLTDIFDRMKEKLQPTIDAFKKLGDTIKDTFGKFVIRAGQDFYNKLLKPLGKWTLSKGLPEFARITENMFKNINWDKLNESLGDLWDAVEPFTEHIGEGLLWFYENALSPVISFTGNKILPKFLNILKNAISGLDTVLQGVSETFKWFFDTVVKPVAESAGKGIEKILTFFEDLTGKVADNKDGLKEFGKFLGSEGIGIGATITTFLAIDAVKKLPGYFKKLATAIKGLSIASIPVMGWVVGIGAIVGAFIYLQQKMDETTEAEQQLFEDLGINVEEWKKKSAGEKADLIDQWLKLEKDFATDEERLRNDRLRGELEFSQKIYRNQQETQDRREKFRKEFKKHWDEFWKKASENFDWLKRKSGEIFSILWNGFIEGGKGAIKAVLTAIQNKLNKWIGDMNWVIDSLNKFPGMGWIPKIPDIKIPGLAQGAVLKGGSPMLAYLNDQPLGQTNIETPLNTMIDAFNTAFKNNNNANPGRITIEASGDMAGLISFLNFRLKREDARIGTNLIKGDVLI